MKRGDKLTLLEESRTVKVFFRFSLIVFTSSSFNFKAHMNVDEDGFITGAMTTAGNVP